MRNIVPERSGLDILDCLTINRQDACSTLSGRPAQRQAQGGELCRTKIARYRSAD